jgi:quinolinate synthase
MKKITLPKIYQSLLTLEPRVEIDATIAEEARLSIERMLTACKTGPKRTSWQYFTAPAA